MLTTTGAAAAATSPSPGAASNLAVQMTGICKRFGAVLANADVDLSVRQGTVHGIVGENGAGKSTLMSVLYGFYRADSGQILINGQDVAIANAHDAIAHGIGMVHQHFMLVDTLTAIENVMLGAEPHVLLAKAALEVRQRMQVLMNSTGLKVALDVPVGELPVGDQQRLEILKALYRGARILILDEPTAVLTPQETQQLFGVLKLLRSQGTTIILITHKLKEVMRLCDDVTVMRAGRVVARVAIEDTSTDHLAEAMVGRKVAAGRSAGAPHAPGYEPGAVKLQATNISLKDSLGIMRLDGISLQLRAGEIVGIAGVSGNGQSELLEVLSGLQAPTSGQLTVEGHTFSAGAWLHPTQARELKLAHVPEDRHARAMVMDFYAWESAVLGYEALPAYSRWCWMKGRQMRAATRAMMERFDVRPRNAQLQSSKFSGGNQQKLVLARELGQAPHVLLVGQPTRGVDIGAIEFIYSQLRALRAQGCAVLVLSSELDEILALSDRVVVMCKGRITGELPVAACSENRLGMLMAGGE
jgi:general nucleoside transport system ATP-binding protein